MLLEPPLQVDPPTLQELFDKGAFGSEAVLRETGDTPGKRELFCKPIHATAFSGDRLFPGQEAKACECSYCFTDLRAKHRRRETAAKRWPSLAKDLKPSRSTSLVVLTDQMGQPAAEQAAAKLNSEYSVDIRVVIEKGMNDLEEMLTGYEQLCFDSGHIIVVSSANDAAH